MLRTFNFTRILLTLFPRLNTKSYLNPRAHNFLFLNKGVINKLSMPVSVRESFLNKPIISWVNKISLGVGNNIHHKHLY